MTADVSITQTLKKMAESDYQKFSQSLILGGLPLLGVRLPRLRCLAKEIAAQQNWESFLLIHPETFFEEVMLKGMVIGYLTLPFEEQLIWVKWFVPKIDNWSICDSFCAGLKIAKKHQKEVWEFLQPFLTSSEEFAVRFGVVMLLDYFVTPQWIEWILPTLCRIKHSGYYVKMAVGWALSVCYVKFPEKTFPFLTLASVDSDTLKKALQKILDSRRIDDSQRKIIRELKYTITQ